MSVYLIPIPIADDALQTLPTEITTHTGQLTYYFVENTRTARRFLRSLHPALVIDNLHFSEIDKHNGPDTALLRTHIENACREKNMIAHALFNSDPLDADKMFREYSDAAQQLAPFVRDTALLLNRALAEGKSIAFEGAQGTMLDIDHGTYPFVTSSSATSGGAATGTGVPPTSIDTVIGITKAYCTRVGSGPFPSELLGADGEDLRKRGSEFGAVTGRPRRTGWLDLPLLRYAGMINGISWLVVTKLDVLDHLEEIPVCVGYKVDGKETDEVPAQACGYEKIECIYRNMPGWASPTQAIRTFEALPKAAREYLAFIEKETGARVGMISTGPDREQTILVDDLVSELGLTSPVAQD